LLAPDALDDAIERGLELRAEAGAGVSWLPPGDLGGGE
jgi:hypothetical protein